MTTRAFTLNTFRQLENSDRRILAALSCVDAITGSPIRQGITLQAPSTRISRNQTGHFILSTAPGFADYQNSVYLEDLSNPPTPQPITLSISDASGHYLPRTFTLTLPRNPATDPGSLTSPDSLFSPAQIPLFPSGLLPINPGWAVLRSTVTNSASQQRLPWALIRIEVDGRQLLAQADHRGEALIAIPGLPITTWATTNGTPSNPAPVTTRDFTANLTVRFDSAVTPLPANTDFLNFNNPNQTYIPDPDDLNSDRPSLLTGSLTVLIASGRDSPFPLAVSLTPLIL